MAARVGRVSDDTGMVGDGDRETAGDEGSRPDPCPGRRMCAIKKHAIADSEFIRSPVPKASDRVRPGSPALSGDGATCLPAVHEGEHGEPEMRRVQMSRIKEVHRLQTLGLSTRRIASSVGVGQSTVVGYLRRATRPENDRDARHARIVWHPAHSNA